MIPEPLWKRALDGRRKEIVDASLRVRFNKGGSDCGRKHPRLRLGDVSGDRTVAKLLPNGIYGERVLAQCACGDRQTLLADNFRRSRSCASCAAKRRAAAVDPPAG